MNAFYIINPELAPFGWKGRPPGGETAGPSFPAGL